MAALHLHATNTTPRHDLSDVQTLLSLANTIPAVKSTSSVGEPTSENSCDSFTDSTVLGFGAGDTDDSTCTMCGTVFKNVQLLKRHLQIHVNAPFACTLCPYVSTDKSTLVRHLRTHNGERPFQCAICKYAFTTKANCERHVRKRHNKQTKAEIRSAMQYNPHMQSQRLSPTFSAHSDSGSTVCKYCNKDFKFNRVLRHHLRSLNNSCSRKPFCCIVCKLGFSTKNNCIRHVLKQHPEFQHKLSEAVSSKPLPMDEASGQDPPVPLTFDNDSDLVNEQNDIEVDDLDDDHNSDHIVPRIEQHKGQAKTIPKPEVLKPTAVILGPVNQVIGTLHKVTMSPAAIDVVKSVTPVVLTTVKTAEVEVKKTFATPEAKVTVIPAAHQKVKEQHPGKIELPPPPQDEPLDLAVHALDLSRKDDAQRPKPVPCTPKNNFIDAILTAAKYVPETPTTSPVNEVVFPKVTNEPVRKKIGVPFTKTFILSEKTRTALKILVNAKKSDERFDEQEQQDLASVSALLNAANSHLMLQHMIGENEKEMTAVKVSRTDPEITPKKGTTEMAEHNNGSRKDSPNSVSCKYCRRKFPWTSSLRRHLLTHTGQKPFKCPHCPIYFTTKSNCERHLLRKHDKLGKATRARGSVLMATRASTSNGNKVVNVPSHRLRVPCPCCSRSFRSEDSLTEHLRQRGKPFRCVICCKLFKEAQECVQHVRRVHDLHVLHTVSTSAEVTEGDGGPRCFVCLQPVESAVLQSHFRSEHTLDSDDNNNNNNNSNNSSNNGSNGGRVYEHDVIEMGPGGAAEQEAVKAST
ncbi:zinc finger protein 236-like [Varroa jacobsoni]|nr:zinc finger protein 236-like [Varroa jacobsoni]